MILLSHLLCGASSAEEVQNRGPASEDEKTAITTHSKSYTDATTAIEFVWIEGGCFQMGDIFGVGDQNEKPVHEVCVEDGNGR